MEAVKTGLSDVEINEISAILKKMYAPLLKGMVKYMEMQRMTYDVFMEGENG